MQSLRLLYRRIRRSLPSVNFRWGAAIAWAVFLLLLEVCGRSSPNDYFDTAIIVLALFWIGVIHTVWPASWLTQLGQVLRRFDQIMPFADIKWGVDFRGIPAMPRRLPPSQFRTLASLISLNISAILLVTYFPGSVRDLLHQYVSTLWLLLWGTLLAGMAATSFFSLFLSWAVIHDEFVMAYRGQGKRSLQREHATLWGVATVIAIAGFLLPVWVPLVFVMASISVILIAAWLTHNDLVMLWRDESDNAIYSLDGRWFVWGFAITFLLVMTFLMLLSTGEMLWHGTSILDTTTTPFALRLGQLFSWISIPGAAMISFYSIRVARQGMAFNLNRVQKKVSDSERQRRTSMGNPTTPSHGSWSGVFVQAESQIEPHKRNRRLDRFAVLVCHRDVTRRI